MLAECLEFLTQEIHLYPLPGRHENVFEKFLVPKILEMDESLSDFIYRAEVSELVSEKDGLNSFQKIMNFLVAVQKTYLRPFPPLGSTLASTGILIKPSMIKEQKSLELFLNNITAHLFYGKNITFHDLILAGSSCCYKKMDPYFLRKRKKCLDKSYFNLADNYSKCFEDGSEQCCSLYHDILIDEHFETFLEIMKHSFRSNFKNEVEKVLFLNNFASRIMQKQNITLIDPPLETFNPFLFCDFSSDLTKSSKTCQKMIPAVTRNGLCHSFNSLPVKSIYQDSNYTKAWYSAFGDKDDPTLEYPKVWGPPHPFYIVVQSFEPSSSRNGKNFLLSFTNEFNNFDVNHDSFEIIPGYQHTYRVIPSQISTSPSFDELDLKIRGCQLKTEISKLSMFKSYTKSGCKFECALKASSNACNCLPWTAPRNQSLFKTCDMIGNLCFKTTLNSPEVYENCYCLNDCQATTFSISESTRPLSWNNNGLNNIPVIENLVEFVYERYRLFFTYEKVLSNAAQDPYSRYDILDFLFQNHISIIKVEMGAKSVIKSVRDVKATFEFQLSAVGKLLQAFIFLLKTWFTNIRSLFFQNLKKFMMSIS